MNKGGKAPTPPDPVATAQAQAQSNKDTAVTEKTLNLVDQNTPLGSLTYSQLPGDVNGVQRWTSNVNLTPEGQKSFDLQQQVGTALNNLALGGTSRVTDAMSSPQSYGSLPQPKGLDTLSLPSLYNINQFNPTRIDLSSLPSMKQFDPSSLPGMKQFDPSGIKGAPTSLDLSSIGPAPTANEADTAKARDALYGLATSRLDPSFALQQKQLEDQITNQGIVRGSDAWNSSLESFGRTRNDAYKNANDQSIAGAADFQRNLFDMSQAAYQDRFNTAQTDFSDATTARSNAIGELQQSVADALLQRQQGAGEMQQQVADSGAQRQQVLGEESAKGQQDMSVSEMLAGLDASQRQQLLGEQSASNATALANRQQGITEANYLRELPINEVSSLINGGQVSMPSFSNQPQTSIAPTNVAGIVQSNYNNQLDAWKTQQQSASSGLGSIFGAAGSVLGGWASVGFI